LKRHYHKSKKKRGLVEKLLDFFLSGKNPEWSVPIHKTVLLKLGKSVITKARIKSGIVEKLWIFSYPVKIQNGQCKFTRRVEIRDILRLGETMSK
jgi:hypothetical protein